MNTNKWLLAASGLALAGCCCFKSNDGCCKYPDSVNEGFVSLFNGVDLEGWVGATDSYVRFRLALCPRKQSRRRPFVPAGPSP